MYFHDCLNDIKHFLAYNFQEFREKMKYRKIMFMLVLAIFIFGAASVCASDVNDTVIASEDTIQTELSAGNENEIVEQASNDEVISEANVGTFQELQENITQGYSSGEITLDRDYECEDEFSAEGITIAQGIIINGQGHKIDAKGKATIFNIQADWVFLKNITFLNGKSKDGGAINWEANLGSVLDCRFVNNTATDDGGAIYWHNRGILSYLNSNLVRGCSFVNNTVTGNGGGAIFFAGGENEYDTTVENCNFEGNSAPTGGAIYYMSEYTATVTDCNFTGNTATVDGGAVYFWYQGTVTNCNFTDNSAYYGGAVYFLDQGTVSNCNFTGNTASRYGGAVYFDETGNVTNCNFTDNTATRDGGAVYFSNTGNVTNCNFTNNKATGTVKYDGGGAVYFYSAGNVTNCNFTDNTATRDGGAVYFYQGTGSVTNCNFTNNKATGTNSWGGAIRISFGSVENCNFTGNTATGDGGAVYFSNTGNVTNCNFTGNTATYNGGAIWMDSGSVSNCNFAGNNATTGSAIYFYKGDSSDTLTVSYSTFLNNRANAGALDIVKTENNITITFIGQNNLLNAIYSRIDAEVAFTNVTYWGAKGITTVSATMSGSNKAAGQNITVGVVVNDKLVLNDVIITNENGTIVLDISAGENYYISARHDADSYYTEAEKTISNNTKFNVNVTSQTTTNKTVNITAKSNIYSELMPGKLLFILLDGTEINATYGGNGTWWAMHKFADYSVYQVNATYEGLDNVTITNGTISISKTPTNITVENETLELFVKDYIATGATLTPADAGNLTFTSSNITVVEVKDGIIEAVGEGSAIITVSFAGSDDYAAADNKTISVTVSLKNASVSVNNATLDLLIGDEFIIVATTDPKGLDVTFTPDNSGVISVDDSGVVTALREGNATVKVKVGGDGVYALNTTDVTVTVKKIPTNITVKNATLELYVEDSIATGVTLTPADAGNVTYTVSNSSVVKVEDGTITAIGGGTAIITVSFAGNDNYTAAENKTITVNVIKYDSKVTISPINDTVYSNNVTIKYAIENKTNVTVTIDGVSDDKISITNDTITVIGLDAGEYTITIINNESSIYHKSNDTKTFTVNKQATSITAADVSTTYNINKELVITLKDANGNPLTGASVTVDLNGAKTYTTDKNGQIKVSTKGLAPKTYTAKITFNGNTNYEKSAKNVKVTVKKATPKLTAKKKTFKTSVKTKKYTITLKDNTGKAIKKAKVTLKVKGKTYKATTNSKGKAVFKIKNLKKKGTFKATITYKGNKYYNKVSKKANIKVIVTFKTVSKGSKDKSTVKEIQQALKDHGYYLSYKGHYLKVDGKFKGCTERSVKEFQKDKGLKVTGKVDEKTAKKLGLI